MDEARRLADLMRQHNAARDLARSIDMSGLSEALRVSQHRLADAAIVPTVQARQFAELASSLTLAKADTRIYADLLNTQQALQSAIAVQDLGAAARVAEALRGLEMRFEVLRETGGAIADTLALARQVDVTKFAHLQRDLGLGSHLEDVGALATTAETFKRLAAARIHFSASIEMRTAIASMAGLSGPWRTGRIALPDVSAVVGMAEAVAAAVEGHARLRRDRLLWRDDLAMRMAAIQMPWVSLRDLGVSALAFGQLASFRDVIAFDDPYARRTNRKVFDELGEVVPDLDDAPPGTREERRETAGRNGALVAFPGPSYGQVVLAAGFQLIVPSAPVPASDDGGVGVFDPGHNAILTSLEQHVRHLVASQLRAIAGEAWIKQRVPGSIWQRWRDRQTNAKEAGERVYQLEQYADFFDLAEIISQKRNWDEAFRVIFIDKQAVQSSFRRLQPIRRHLAHARPLTAGDVLDLLSESSRLFRAMGFDVLRN